MAQTGSYIDTSEASKSLASVNAEYRNLIKEFEKDVKEAVDRIQEGWKGQDCVDFVNKNLLPAVEEASEEIKKVFQSINDTVTQNAQNYERRFYNGRKLFHAAAFAPIKLSIAAANAFTGTVIGITNEAAIETAKSTMERLQKQTEIILENARKAAAKSGFYGGGQQAKYTASINKIKSSIGGVAEGIKSASKKVTENAVNEARNIAKANEQAF